MQPGIQVKNPISVMPESIMIAHLQSTAKTLLKTIFILFFIISFPLASFADTNVNGTISTDTTWTLAGSPYIVTGNVQVGRYNSNPATLTIEPGVEVRFNAGTHLLIGWNSYYYGALNATGTPSNPITFTSNAASPSPGDWNGIYFSNYTADDLTTLEHCTVEYGGANTYGNLFFQNASGTVKNCTIKNSSTNGIYLDGNSSPSIIFCNINNNTKNGIYGAENAEAAITDNNISDNQEYPINAHPNRMEGIKNNTGFGNIQDGILLRGGTVNKDVTWSDQNLPYLIAGNVQVGKYNSSPATLTIEPGVEIRFNTDTHLLIGWNNYYYGALIAQGTPSNPITFASNASNPAPGDWNGIYFSNYNADNFTTLEHCIVEYGGANTYGNLYFENASGTINNCTIKNSSTNGIYLKGNSSPSISACIISDNATNGIYGADGAAAIITDNNISNNQEYPINVHPNNVEEIKSNTGSGNIQDGILVRAGIVSNDATWADQDLPYFIAGNVQVGKYNSAPAVLTIEPGVEVRFNTGTHLLLGWNNYYYGALIAQGTQSNQITFTSNATTPAPGDWNGIYFSNYNADNFTILEHCIVEYGGANTFGNLYFENASGTINNCTIKNSSTNGIYLDGSSSPSITFCKINNNTNNGIYGTGSAAATISENNISDNQEYPINIHPNNVDFVKNTTGTGNTHNGIGIRAGIISENAVWENQELPYNITGSVQVGKYNSNPATLIIEPGVEVRFDSGTHLLIGWNNYYYGALIAQGTESTPITFTSNATTPSPGDWNGIHFSNYTNDNYSFLEHCTVEYAGNNTNQANIYLYNASPHIQYNTIRYSSSNGIRVVGGGSNNALLNCNTIEDNQTGIKLETTSIPSVTGNNFARNTAYAINNNTSNTIDAKDSWWNDVNGPGYNGDDVSGNIDFTPWLTTASTCINNEATNIPPYAPKDPSPVNNTVNVAMTDGAVTATWSCSDPNLTDTLVYDVYFGIMDNALSLVGQSITSSQFELTDLQTGKTYYWQIIARDTAGDIKEGPVWKFTTAGPPPDLTVSSISWNPETNLSADQEITFTITLENNSAGACVTPFSTILRIDGTNVKTWNTNQIIISGESIDISCVWIATTGDHTIEVETDTNNSITESNETNNILTQMITGIADPEPPTLVSTVPANNSFVKQINSIIITLQDEHGQIDDAAVIASIIVHDPNQVQVAGSTNEDNDVFTFTPSSAPSLNGTYTVLLTAKDAWGNTQDFNFSFILDTVPPFEPTITGGVVFTGTIQVQPFQNLSIDSLVTFTGTREDDTRAVISIQSTSFMENIGTIINVGPLRQYTTIQEAIDAAVDGDMILIEPGTYLENIILNKWVHIKGNSFNPDDVIIISPGSSYNGYPRSFQCEINYPSPLDTPLYIEGVRIDPYGYPWQIGLGLPQSDEHGSGTIIFNRCKFVASSNSYLADRFGYASVPETFIRFVNCDIQRGYAHFLYMNSPNWSLEKCQLNNSYYCYICTTTPDPNDYVTSSTPGYGAAQGAWILGYTEAVSDFGSEEWTVDITLAEGLNTLKVQLEDRAGNRSTSLFVDIAIDSQAPVINSITPLDNAFLNEVATSIVVGYTEITSELDMDASILSVKDMTLTLVPGDWSDTGEGELVFTPAVEFEESVYQIEIQLHDIYGHQSPAMMTHFTIDITLPSDPVLDPVTTPSESVTQTITGTKEAFAAIWMNGVQVIDHTDQTQWEYQVNLITGQNQFSFMAKDRAGNESNAVQVDIFFDDTPPLPVDNLVVYPDGDGTYVHLDWNGYDESIHGDIAGYKVYVQTSSFSSITDLTPYATLNAGTFELKADNLTRLTPYFFAVVAVDNSGNFLEDVTPVSATPNDIVPPENVTNLWADCFATGLILYFQHSADSGNDLAGYKVYFNGDTTGEAIAATQNSLEKSDLAPATAYDFKVTSIDVDGNESSGITYQGITLLANPVNMAVTPQSGYVSLSWDASLLPHYVKHYNIYAKETPFTSVEGLTPNQSTPDLSANIAGLTNNTTYYFAVTAVNLSNGEQKEVTTVTGTPADDTDGPQLNTILFNDAPLTDGQNLTTSGKVEVVMDDPADVTAVEFYFNNTMIRKDFSKPYTAYIDLYTIPDGTYPLTVTGFDTLGNSADYTYQLVVGLSVPPAPVITDPVNNYVTNQTQVVIKGTTDKYTDVTLIHDDTATLSTVSVGPLGEFSISYTLNQGENRIKATAQNRSGQSPDSSEILITVDTSIPDSPGSLSGQPKADGAIQLLWQRPLNKVVKGFNIYRLDTEFTTKAQAVKINQNLILSTGYTDLPPNEGRWFYRVMAVDAASNESALSEQASILSDSTPPKAVQIQYTSHGMVDPVLQRYAPARVDLVLTVSEALSVLPFLTMTPDGGIPQSVELEKVSDLEYSGFFDILPTMPQGFAYAVFSARDIAGNRGTVIETGDRLLLDTKGPGIKRLDMTPGSPVKNFSDTPVEIQLSFGLTEKMKPGELPQIRLDIANGRQIVDVTNLTETAPQTDEAQAWEAGIVLPSDAGLAAPESIEILYSGMDDLDNTSTQILVNSLFQVYQGGLPPLAPPASLTGKAVAQGKVELTWTQVQDAAGYQIYRQAPGEQELTLSDTLEDVTTFTDTTDTDGTYLYAVATIRNENEEESISSLSNTISVDTDATIPNAPINLVLDMVSQGIRAQWEAPAFTESITYSVYRSDQTQITSVEGLTPLATGITQLMIIDPTPSPTDHCYAITAVDAAGNESLPSNSYYLNFDLLPVSVIEISQTDYDPPQLTWSHADNTDNIAGYYLYIGKDRNGFKVNEALMTAESFTDYGYAGEERSYTVIAVDTNAVESMSRFVTLPKVSASLTEGAIIKRGIMNKLEYRVKNESASQINSIMIKTLLGGHTHQSQIFSLASQESKTIPVIVGGYTELTDIETLTTTLEITPNPGEKASIIRTAEIEVQESLMVLQIQNEEFIRGTSGIIRFTLENPGAAVTEIITAENSGNNASTQITCYLMDEDENVLYSKSFKQALGDNIITLPNKKTVARIAQNSIFTSGPMDLFIPANAPDEIYVHLEIDNIYYHLGQSDQVTMNGTKTRQKLSLKDTSYYGEITSITPEVSKGDEDIVITGRAIDRATNEAMADTQLNLIISVSGFERKFAVTTDETGQFTHTFTPLEDEAGVYHVHAIHPDLLDRPEQGTFIINQVEIAPSKVQLSIPKNYEQKITIKVTTQKGTELTNLRLELKDNSPLPQGVHVTLDDPIPTVAQDRTVSLNLTLWADNSADEFTSLELSVKSDESLDNPWGSILIDAQFSESRPVLYFTPDHIETGVALDDIITETITLKNSGLADMGDVTLELIDENNQPAPSWVRLNTPSDIGTLEVGGTRKVSISFLPGSGINQGLHIFYLTVTSSNYPETHIGLYPMVTSSGVGNVLFKISDIYTGTFNLKNELIRGLANAKIKLQNETTFTTHTATTDNFGEALFEDLSTGAYKCRITAGNHQEYTGRVWIKPGITTSFDKFLEYNLVTVEWEVNEITIQDKYEILLTATFETDVPAAVVVAQPLSITLPDMVKGDVFHGEFILINHGLIRADNLEIPIPKSDENFQYEILTGLPDTLEAKQRLTIPYRVTCLMSLDREEEEQTGGGCYTYRKCIPISYGYTCTNGEISNGTTQHCFYKSGGTCGGSGGGGSGTSTSYVIGTGGSTGTTTSPAPGYTPMSSPEQKCLPKPDPKECITGNCKETGQNQNTSIGSEINTVMREFRDDAVDLMVKVPNGVISVNRRYRSGRWQWDDLNKVVDGKLDDPKVYALSEYGPDDVTRGDVPYEKVSLGIYQNDTFIIERKTDCEQYLGTPEWGQCISGNADDYQEDKYVFKDKSGNWKHYDSSGRLMSYGNRYGVTASLIYDSQEDEAPSGILDKNDTQVLWFEYNTDNNLARIYDADARQTRYEYSGTNLTKVIDVMDKETIYEYDGKNNIIRKTNAEGYATSISYSNSGDPVKVEDDNGGIYTFEYDYDKNKKEYYALIKNPAGMIKEVWYSDIGDTKRLDINGRTIQKIAQDGNTHIITDEKSSKTIKEYDEWDNLKSVSYPDNTRVLYEYDLKFNKIKTKQDQLNRITQYEYDDNGNLLQKTEAKGTVQERITSYTYDDYGRVLTITTAADANSNETVTTFTYDDKGNIATIADPENSLTQLLEYDIMGNLIRKEDARSKTWIYEYDAKGRLVSSTDPLNHKTSYEYDGVDNRTAVINADLKRFEYEYDPKGNLVKTTDPLNNITLFEYSLDDKLIKQIDPEGKATVYEYDQDRLLVKTIDPGGNITQMEYNQEGCSSCSGGSTSPDKVMFPTFDKTYTYDTLGRKLTETDILNDTVSYTTQFGYDLTGNLLKKTDRREKETHYVYDNLNRLNMVVDPADGSTGYTYDNRDNLVSLIDADQNTTTFEYDTNNRLIKEIRPMGEETIYNYDENGNLISKIDAKNQMTTYTYDDANRLTHIRYYASSIDPNPVKTVEFTYDNTGNLLTWSDGTTSSTYTYDDLNRKLSETVNYGTFAKTLNYTWYKNSLKQSFTAPDNTQYQYTYNDNNQLAGIDIPEVGTISNSAYKWTQPATTLLPGGSSTTKTFDALMRTTSITAKDPGSNPTMEYSYTFDPMDNITAKTTEHGDYAYTYDNLYRLTDTDNPNIPELADEAFSYV